MAILWKETFKGFVGPVVGLAVVGGLVLGFTSLADSKQSARDGNGDISKAGSLGAPQIALGDCFQNPSDGAQISTVTAIPCAQPHTAQAYGYFAYPNPPDLEPDETTIDAQAGPACEQQLGSLADASKVPAGGSVSELIPSPGTWNSGTHDVTCVYESATAWSGSIMK